MQRVTTTIFLVAFFISANAQLKSPEQFLGYRIGTHFTPHWKVVNYFQQIGNAAGLEKLTNREKQVLACLVEGWLYKEIAHRLGISLDTTRKHLCNIYRKLQVSSRTEAVVKYLRLKP